MAHSGGVARFGYAGRYNQHPRRRWFDYNDDYTGYFAILMREDFDEDYICGSNAIAKIIYNYPYVGSEYTTPHYSRYTMLLESYKQNTSLIPVDKKVYDRIAVNTLY